MKKVHWMKLISFKYSWYEIVDYFRANIRYFCYYNSKFRHLLKPHIIEQIDFRINVMMDHECYNNGSCKICGCTTTNLQMANKPCEGLCYPPIVGKDHWKAFKNHGVINDTENNLLWKNILKIDRQFNTACKPYIHKHDYICGIDKK